MSTELEKNILTTVTYYDVMDYPMTAFEIWKHLTLINEQGTVDSKQYNLQDVIKELESENIQKFIEEYQGFYFLKGRKNLVSERLKKNKISQSKFRKVRWVLSLLRFVPYVRMAAVTGSVAMKNALPESDIDLLVVLKKNKIFTGRTLVTLLLHLLGRRRHGRKITNRICLNYFITTDSLEINLKDIFAASEYSFIFPAYGLKTFRSFISQNAWIKNYKPNRQEEILPNPRIIADSHFSKIIKNIREFLLKPKIIESWLKQWQIKRIMANPKTHKQGSIVIADEKKLVFLPEPQGPIIYDKFKARLADLKA
ncbi:MAG: nucleotidyltransferase domain-containing protein [Candidatus Moranbacteria bacterium]|nr:nucleotidyltransferase domain-containing protein [Candidatus Moranbacteria bacterium]